MRAEHFELLVEEPSMEGFLNSFLPRLLQNRASFTVHPHQGKSDLLGKLDGKLRAYSHWLPLEYRIVLIIDRDDEDCLSLKGRLEAAADVSGLLTRTMCAGQPWRMVNRIAVEELEAWYFGDWTGVRTCYPNLPATIPNQAPYRDPDAILGGTWEAFERVCKQAGYFAGGLRKLEAATLIGDKLSLDGGSSKSLAALSAALIEAVS